MIFISGNKKMSFHCAYETVAALLKVTSSFPFPMDFITIPIFIAASTEMQIQDDSRTLLEDFLPKIVDWSNLTDKQAARLISMFFKLFTRAA